MKRLKELFEMFPSANSFVFCDRGDGWAFGAHGRLFFRDAETDAEYGDIELRALDQVIHSTDGHPCLWASDWIVGGKGNDPQYQFRLMF